MSHFTRIRTRFVDPQRLASALEQLGFKTIEVHEIPKHLYGYLGDLRSERAEIIIRRKHIGRMSNDIGFARNQEGAFDAVISEFDRTKYDDRWLGALAQHYACSAARDKLEEQGFTLVEEQKSVEGQIHLVLRRSG